MAQLDVFHAKHTHTHSDDQTHNVKYDSMGTVFCFHKHTLPVSCMYQQLENEQLNNSYIHRTKTNETNKKNSNT